MSQINLMAVVEPNPLAIYQETYQKAEVIVPKKKGAYTFYYAQGIYTQESKLTQPLPILPGTLAPYDVIVLWVAVNNEAIDACTPKILQTPRLMTSA